MIGITLSIIITLLQFHLIKSCDIVGASACPPKPDKDLRQDDFAAYCNQAKNNILCIWDKYAFCEHNTEYKSAIDDMIERLEWKAYDLSEDCGIEMDLKEHRTTTRRPRRRGRPRGRGRATTSQLVDTTSPPVKCPLEDLSKQCKPILPKLLQFNKKWSRVVKVKWCGQVQKFNKCAKPLMVKCSMSDDAAKYKDVVNYYEKLQNVISSQANMFCVGGIEGCEKNFVNPACRQLQFNQRRQSLRKFSKSVARSSATFLYTLPKLSNTNLSQFYLNLFNSLIYLTIGISLYNS
ncbi:hypothetical protein SNEBB_001219 [Seison nebaliae]|nr:hypothetical protein SNEBB_001219 [Seison nebaliae]